MENISPYKIARNLVCSYDGVIQNALRELQTAIFKSYPPEFPEHSVSKETLTHFNLNTIRAKREIMCNIEVALIKGLEEIYKSYEEALNSNKNENKNA